GAAGLTDRERGAGVGADERLLERDGIRAVLLDETLDALEDRLQTSRQMFAGARAPPPEIHGPEAPVVFVDDSVSACSRAWVDAEDFHGQRLGAGPDNPAIATRGLCGRDLEDALQGGGVSERVRRRDLHRAR